MVKYKYNENWRERDKVYEEMPDAILRILFRRQWSRSDITPIAERKGETTEDNAGKSRSLSRGKAISYDERMVRLKERQK